MLALLYSQAWTLAALFWRPAQPNLLQGSPQRVARLAPAPPILQAPKVRRLAAATHRPATMPRPTARPRPCRARRAKSSRWRGSHRAQSARSRAERWRRARAARAAYPGEPLLLCLGNCTFQRLCQAQRSRLAKGSALSPPHLTCCSPAGKFQLTSYSCIRCLSGRYQDVPGAPGEAACLRVHALRLTHPASCRREGAALARRCTWSELLAVKGTEHTLKRAACSPALFTWPLQACRWRSAASPARLAHTVTTRVRRSQRCGSH